MPDRAFICDSMLGRLARNLRMLGFDTLYSSTAPLEELASAAQAENRTLLTRRTALLKKRTTGTSCLFIQGNNPAGQLKEVLSACGIGQSDMRPFSLCLRCNARLEPVEKNTAALRVPGYVAETVESFTSCPVCGRIYWKGTHYENMMSVLGIKERKKIPDKPE